MLDEWEIRLYVVILFHNVDWFSSTVDILMLGASWSYFFSDVNYGFLKCFVTLSMFSKFGTSNVVHTIYQPTIHNVGGPHCRLQYSIGFRIWCAMYKYIFNKSTPLLEVWRWAKVLSTSGIVTKTYLQENTSDCLKMMISLSNRAHFPQTKHLINYFYFYL